MSSKRVGPWSETSDTLVSAPETSVRVDWWDAAYGGWTDIGEAASESAAAHRIAGLMASDAAAGNDYRYRVTTSSVVYFTRRAS